MAEIILPPEENEETPQTPELNLDKPSDNSKVIKIEFEAKKTNKVSTKDTNQQLYTTDTDAWFEFKETSLEGANGTYSVVFRNRHDGSIFQRTGDVVSGVAYYKIPHQEIRHAGAWRGQIVYTLENGNTTAREFGYDVKGHILDGKDVREIVVEDFETLMSQLRSMKDNAEVELASLKQELENTTDTAEQNETDRQAFFDDLVEDIDELQANYQELLDTGVLQTNINTKLEALEEEYAPKLTEVTAQLAQKASKSEVRKDTDIQPISVHEMDTETKQLFTGGAVAVVGENAVGNENVKEKAVTPIKTSFLNPYRELPLELGTIENGDFKPSHSRVRYPHVITGGFGNKVIRKDDNYLYGVFTYDEYGDNDGVARGWIDEDEYDIPDGLDFSLVVRNRNNGAINDEIERVNAGVKLAYDVKAITQNSHLASVKEQNTWKKGNIGSLNRYDIKAKTSGGYISAHTLKFVPHEVFGETDYMAVTPNKTYTKSFNSGHIIYYDHKFEIIMAEELIERTHFTVPDNDKIAYVRMSIRHDRDIETMVVEVANDEVELNKYIPFVDGSTTILELDDRVKINDYNLKEESINRAKLSKELTEQLNEIGKLQPNKPTKTSGFSERYNNIICTDYLRDEVTGTSYQITRITQKKFDGTLLIPRIQLTSSGIGKGDTKTTLQYMEANNHDFAINGGIFDMSSDLSDGTIISKGEVLQDAQPSTHFHQYTLGIKSNGEMTSFPYNISGQEMVDTHDIVEAVVGFVPIIVNGEKTTSDVLELCPHGAVSNPRQVIGQLINGDYITLTCDGRASGEKGFTLIDMQRILMERKDVKFAYNLDGGGSTSTVVEKKHINRIIEGQKGRRVPNIITFD